MHSQETQIETGIHLKCNECNFEASNNSELSWHQNKNHGWQQNIDDLDMTEGPRYCNKYESES